MFNLHSMCARTASKPGEDTLAIFVSILFYPSSHMPLSFLRLSFSSVIYILFLMKLVALVYQICYFCVYFCQHRFNFQTSSTVPFPNIVLVTLQLFLCLFSMFYFLNRRLLFCDTGYHLYLPSWILVYKFSQNWHFYLVAPCICVFVFWLAPRYSFSLRFRLRMTINSA